jgi:ketosteroid isomerase-like protein
MTAGKVTAGDMRDVEAIRSLKLRYAELCDTGYDPDELTALFVDDGIFEVTGQVHYQGREQLREHWINVGGRIQFALHFITNHLIEVDPSGTEAEGRPYTLCAAYMDGAAYWQGLRYRERYRKIDDRWYFAHIHMTVEFSTPYDESWASQVASASV